MLKTLLGIILFYTLAGAQTVAVLSYETTGLAPDQEWMGDSFADAQIGRLLKTTRCRVVERQFLDKVIQELQLSLTDLVDPSSAARVGELLGARLVIVGRIEVLGEHASVRARWIAAETGEVLGQEEVNGPQTSLLAMRERLAAFVSHQFGGPEPGRIELWGPTTSGELRALEDLRCITKDFPVLGLDPQASRRISEYRSALVLAEARSGYPRSPELRIETAKLMVQMREYQKALGQLMSSLPTELECDAGLIRANVLFMKGDPFQAEQELLAVLRQCRDSGLFWEALARCRFHVGDERGALFALLSGLGSKGPHRRLVAQLRSALSRNDTGTQITEVGEIDEALARVASALECYFRGDIDRALGYLSAVPVERESFATYLIKGLGLLRKGDQGNLLRAREELMKSLSLRPDQPEVYRGLALIDARLGNCVQAEQNLTLYLCTAGFVDDYSSIELDVARCRDNQR